MITGLSFQEKLLAGPDYARYDGLCCNSAFFLINLGYKILFVKLGEQFFLAFRAYGEVLRTIDKHGLWSIFILPSILSLAIAVVIGAFAWVTSDDIVLYFTNKFHLVDYNTKIGNLFEIFVVITIRGITLFVYLKLFRYLILIILSPVFVNISKVLYKSMEGEDHKMNIWNYCFCSFRGIEFALRNFVLDILVTLLLLVLSLIVLWIFPLIPILILIVESYFFAIVLMDYRYEKEGLTLKESIRRSRNLPGVPIGIGLIFNLSLLVPLLGVIFGPVLAFVAAQESIHEIEAS